MASLPWMTGYKGNRMEYGKGATPSERVVAP